MAVFLTEPLPATPHCPEKPRPAFLCRETVPKAPSPHTRSGPRRSAQGGEIAAGKARGARRRGFEQGRDGARRPSRSRAPGETSPSLFRSAVAEPPSAHW